MDETVAQVFNVHQLYTYGPLVDVQATEKEVSQMLKEESFSPWSSLIVVVLNPEGNLRLCNNFFSLKGIGRKPRPQKPKSKQTSAPQLATGSTRFYLLPNSSAS